MPRKIRQLRADLRKRGLVSLKKRGKGDHEVWEHPTIPGIHIVLDGRDGDDVKPYMEQDLRDARNKIRNAGS